jgi:16S rRNA (adenine1518-N6/adenine1519-N6)-dimethyltransferase
MQKNQNTKIKHFAKKSLGQNFLKSEMALKKIVEAGEIQPDDIILEIGPGKGALTEKLLSTLNASPKKADKEKVGYVIAVEKDRELFEFLKTKFEKEIENKKLILINEDVLQFNLEREQNILERTLGRSGDDGQRKFSAENFRGESENVLLSFKIIANIPYNITGAILKKFLTAENQPERMVLMVQNEVAKRIVGRGSNPSTPLKVKESILSISVKAYGEPKMIMKVPARYFSPAPKVDSAIISIKNISRKIFTENNINEEKFWEIVKAGFAHKRKKLSSNLKSIQYGGNSSADTLMENLGNKRAEDLTLLDWIMLAKN